MDYEKKYKEALVRAKKALQYDDCNVCSYIFPELTKSEDEVIREEIIDFLSLPHPQFVGKRNHEEWIAWLKKQGEQKDILEGAVLDSNKDGLIADTIRYKTEKQSVEYSKDNLPEFESYLCLMFQKFRTKGVCTNGEIIDFVKEHAQKLKDTLCHAWSEEDELNLSEALHHIRMYNLANKADKLDKWLKSLKDRVQPQSDWSEEDETYSDHIITAIKSYYTDDAGIENPWKEELLRWFKSFKERLQPQHKLSEEDYNEIETIACHLDNINNEGMAKVLRSIRDKYYSQSIGH